MKNQLEIHVGKNLILTRSLYVCFSCLFTSLTDGCMKCRVACKGIHVEASTKERAVMIHRWEFNINMRDDLPGRQTYS